MLSIIFYKIHRSDTRICIPFGASTSCNFLPPAIKTFWTISENSWSCNNACVTKCIHAKYVLLLSYQPSRWIEGKRLRIQNRIVVALSLFSRVHVCFPPLWSNISCHKLRRRRSMQLISVLGIFHIFHATTAIYLSVQYLESSSSILHWLWWQV